MQIGLGIPLAGRRVGGDTAFTPASLLASEARYKFSDESSLTFDSKRFVTNTADQTTNDRDITSLTGEIRLPASGYALGGKNAVYFNGYASGSYLPTTFTPDDEFWVAVYVQRGVQRLGGSSIRPIVAFGATGNDEISIGTRNGNTDALSTLYEYNGNSAGTLFETSSGSFTTGDRTSIIWHYKKDSFSRVYRDGTLVIDNTTNALKSPGVMHIGGSAADFRRMFGGIISEIAVGNGPISQSEREEIDTYFASEYGSGTDVSVMYSIDSITTSASDVDSNQSVVVGSTWRFTTSTETPDTVVTTWNSSWVSQSTYDTLTDTGSEHTQSNGMFYDEANQKLYVGANNFPNTPRKGWILEYDVDAGTGALTLATGGVHDVSPGWSEGCAKYGDEFFVIFHDLFEIHRYNSSWVLQEKHSLPNAEYSDTDGTQGEPYLHQSATFIGDVIYLPTHNANSFFAALWSYYWTGSEFIPAVPNIITPQDTQGTQGVSYTAATSKVWLAHRGDTSVHDARVGDAVTRTMKVG